MTKRLGSVTEFSLIGLNNPANGLADKYSGEPLRIVSPCEESASVIDRPRSEGLARIGSGDYAKPQEAAHSGSFASPIMPLRECARMMAG
jgi:hypothetical protein